MKDPKTDKLYKRTRDKIYCIRISKKENIYKYTRLVGFSINRKQKSLMIYY